MKSGRNTLFVLLSFIGLVFFPRILCFIDFTETSFGIHNKGILAAFGDYNSDGLTDAFVIKNRTNFTIYLAYIKEPLLRPSQLQCNFTKFAITSIVPGDFDGDAFMDILLTTTPINDYFSAKQDLRIVWGGKPILNCSDADGIQATSYGQPLALDYNQDMIVDLFGVNLREERVFWVFNSSRTPPKELKMKVKRSKPVKLPHSNSFIDINNDNSADLLVTTNFDIEVWLGSNHPDFVYNSTIEYIVGSPTYFGQAIYVDIELTGHFFILLPVCYDPDCKNSTILIYDNSNWLPLLINFDDEAGKRWHFPPVHNELYLDTINMRYGDYSLDGYPDLLVTLIQEETKTTSIFLLLNVPCTLPECKFSRTFEVQWSRFGSLNSSVSAAFYDFNMDGVLDIVYMKKNGTQYSMHSIKNELEYDTNFINVIVLTGLTNNEVMSQPLQGIRTKKGTYGTNLPGPKISYNMISEDGAARVGVCAQLPQSAYFSLHLPYSVFGLQRTPNFVDTLSVGLSGYSHTWTQIIPNSQLVVIPYPPSQPSEWKAQLFVTPSKIILKSVYVMLAIFIGTVICIGVLHKKEQKEHSNVVEINRENYVRM